MKTGLFCATTPVRLSTDNRHVKAMTEPQTRNHFNFPASYYLAHAYLILHIITGILIESFKFLGTGHYRIVGMATWPWTLTGAMFWLVVSVIVHMMAIGHIVKQIRERLEAYPINFRSMFIFPFYFLSLFLQIIRFMAWIIGIGG